MRQKSLSLATGVYIAKFDSSEASCLRIADPPPRGLEEQPVCVVEATVPQMTRAIKADTIARGLLAAGFVPEARSLMPGNTDLNWNPRLEGRDRFRVDDIEWRGHIDRFELPIPVRIENREYRAATVRDGVSTRFLHTMRQLPAGDHATDALLDEAQTQMRPLHHEETAAAVGGLYGGVRHGDVAIRDISLISG
jgi:hypothetical protein